MVYFTLYLYIIPDKITPAIPKIITILKPAGAGGKPPVSPNILENHMIFQ